MAERGKNDDDSGIDPHVHVHVHLHKDSCGSVTQDQIGYLTVSLTRSSDRLAKALKKAMKDTYGNSEPQR